MAATVSSGNMPRSIAPTDTAGVVEVPKVALRDAIRILDDLPIRSRWCEVPASLLATSNHRTACSGESAKRERSSKSARRSSVNFAQVDRRRHVGRVRAIGWRLCRRSTTCLRRARDPRPARLHPMRSARETEPCPGASPLLQVPIPVPGMRHAATQVLDICSFNHSSRAAQGPSAMPCSLILRTDSRHLTSVERATSAVACSEKYEKDRWWARSGVTAISIQEFPASDVLLEITGGFEVLVVREEEAFFTVRRRTEWLIKPSPRSVEPDCRPLSRNQDGPPTFVIRPTPTTRRRIESEIG